MSRLLRLALATCGIASTLVSQRFPDRSMTFNPLGDSKLSEAPDSWSWMHSTGGWGEFGAYRLARDREHAWLQKLGAFVELFRISNEASLAFLSSIEFIANPDNDIRFNPRAVFWDEGFLFTRRAGTHFWQIGYFHRCKHDVDNLILGRERSLIFGSILAKYLIPFKWDDQKTDGLITLRSDLYTIRQDDRYPQHLSDRLPHVKRMLGTVAGLAHFRQQLGASSFGLYLTYWGSVNLYSSKEGVIQRFGAVKSATLDGGLTGGIAVQGNAHFRIGFSYEYLSDTGLNPIPEHAHLLSLGVTILNPSTMW